MPEDRKKFFKATLVVSVCTFLSHVLGLLRSTLMSAIYGATNGEGLADAYTAAFKLPNVIYTLVAAGIISIVLIPYFLTVHKKTNWDELNRACSGFVNFFLVVISGFIVLGMIFAEPLVRHLLLAGWTDEKNIGLTVDMTRIILLQVLFFTLSSVFGSYLNALEKFTAYALAMLSYNVGTILGIVALAPVIGITGVAWGVVAGGFFHFAIQLAGSIKNGFRYAFSFPRVDKDLVRMVLNGIPRIVTLGMDQIVRFALVAFASFLAGGSILIYDNVENISLVPYGLIAISISTTAFPIFIKYYNDNDFRGLYESLFDKLRMLLFFTLPVCTALFVFRREVADVLFGYHNYGTGDVIITGNALGYYVLGIPFLAMTLVIVKFYYAIVRSLIPMFVALASVAVSLLLCYVFSKTMDVSGLSLGRSIGYIIQAAALMAVIMVLIRSNTGVKGLSITPVIDMAKIALLCIPVFALCLSIEMNANFFDSYKLNSMLKLAVSALVTVPLYFVLARIANIPESRLVRLPGKRAGKDAG